ncbi:YtxH domain-containing protein [Candidatus Gottesmanbacteria bacterium]|nr:YtxH domain-containing protein [Candidatus Gottesmanbacteria bacterium]
MNEQNHRDGKFWAGFFLGGLIGAVTLFFLGTKEGKKTGKMLEKKGQDILDNLQDKKDEIIEKLEDKKEDLTEQAADKLDDALSQIEDLNEKTLKTTANLRKVFKNLPKKKN